MLYNTKNFKNATNMIYNYKYNCGLKEPKCTKDLSEISNVEKKI